MDTDKDRTGYLRAVIFDVDGTLVDSNDFHAEAWVEAFRKYGKTVSSAEIHPHIGKGGDQLVPEFLTSDEVERFGKELEEYRSRLFQDKYLPMVKPFPGVRGLFEKINENGLKIALASSSKEAEVEKHIENLGVKDLIDSATSADDAQRSKPRPDIFEAALEKLSDVRPREAIVVGDSPWDVMAAQKAGMLTIGLLSGGFLREELFSVGAVEVYDDTADLLAKFDESVLMRSARASAAK